VCATCDWGCGLRKITENQIPSAHQFWPTGSVTRAPRVKDRRFSPKDPIRTDLKHNPGFLAAIVQPKRKVERAPGRGRRGGKCHGFSSAPQFTFTWVTHFAFDCSLHFTLPAASGRWPVASCPPPAAGCWLLVVFCRLLVAGEPLGWCGVARVVQGAGDRSAASLARWYPCRERKTGS